MSDSLYKIIQDIKQDVGRIGNKIARGVAQVAFEDMQEAHKQIMDSFYSWNKHVKTYTFLYKDKKDGQQKKGYAHGYKRTGNLRENSIIPDGVTSSGKHSFNAKISIGSSAMSDYTNPAGFTRSADDVFDLMWNQGVRGLPEGFRGYIGGVNISASPADISISGTPDQAMDKFMDDWATIRGGKVADMIAGV